MYVFRVPLFIILAWGILLLGAYLLALKLRMSKVSRVFFIPLFVSLVDFVIEGVSVSLGYWEWLGVEGGGSLFFSILPANFVGWIGVSFGFILCYEYFERKWISSFLGYGIFLIVGLFFESVSRVFGFVGHEKYFALIIVLFCFVYFWVYFYHRNKVLKKNRKEFRVDFSYAKWVVRMRVVFYLFALFYFIWNRHYFDFVYFVVILVAILIEVYFFLRFRGILKKRV